MSELEMFRAEKDNYFTNHPNSPLTDDQKREFRGLNYFPENPSLRLEVTVEKFLDQDEIEIQTSTGDTQIYTRYGKFAFQAEGEEAELTIFYNQNGYFLPFVDQRAGKETYPAGRYLEIEQLPNGKFLVDFNMAYNPYCAYNEYWSCPLTPFENRIKVPILAGEKIYNNDIHI
jgi:uncharacterized protein (DUF1684 family)